MKVSWEVSVRRALCLSELVEFESLLSLISNVFLCNEDDSRIWKPNTAGSFSSKSYCRELGLLMGERSSSVVVWLGPAPPRVEAFYWLAVAGKISTVGSLRRVLMSYSFSDMCCLCVRERESVDHIFLHLGLA